VTVLETARRVVRPVGASIKAIPVMTSWVLPTSLQSIRPASSMSRGFPKTSVPSATKVSAPSTIASGHRRATAAAFSLALKRTSSLGVREVDVTSSTSGRTTSGSNLASRSSWMRRGELEARMKRFIEGTCRRAEEKRTLWAASQEAVRFPTAVCLPLVRRCIGRQRCCFSFVASPFSTVDGLSSL
jgi:hypothetical protein